jgi:NIMA (never in mitosis gene a)-related kinase
MYDFVRILGRGSMALVELWKLKNGKQELRVAKRVHLGELDEAEEHEARQEAHLLKGLRHPHIVRYYSSWLNRADNELVIIQEFCEGGDLAQLIVRAREEIVSAPRRAAGTCTEIFTHERRWQWLFQLVHALQYCHVKLRILHRDLKPGNVFVSGKYEHLHIGDFGVAKVLDTTCGLVETFIGTQIYMSPEALRMQSYGTKNDVWGLGIILFEMCTLRRPFEGKDAIQMVLAIAAPGESPKIPDGDCDKEMQDICAAMLKKNHLERPTLCHLLCNYKQLREGVVRLEKDLGWKESLVPKLQEDPKTIIEDTPSGCDGPTLEPLEELGISSASHTFVPSARSRDDILDSSGSVLSHLVSGHKAVVDEASAPVIEASASQGERRDSPTIGEAGVGHRNVDDNGPKRMSAGELSFNSSVAAGLLSPHSSAGGLAAFVAERAKQLAQSPGSSQNQLPQNHVLSEAPECLDIPSDVGTAEQSRGLPSGSQHWSFSRGTPSSVSEASPGQLVKNSVTAENSKTLGNASDPGIDAVAASNPIRSAISAIEETLQRRDDDAKVGQNASSSVVAAIEAAINEAAQVQDVLEVAMRKTELGEVLAWASSARPQIQEPGNDALPGNSTSHEKALSAAGFRSEARKEAASDPVPSSLPHVPDSEVSQMDVPMRIEPAQAAAVASRPTAVLSRQGSDKAAIVDARLRCVEMLRAKEPDPAEFSSTLQAAKELRMGDEPCGKAVLTKAHRLSMHATDVVADPEAPVAKVERAAEMLAAVKEEAGPPDQVLEDANARLATALVAEQRVAIRCQCGPLVRLVSVSRDTPFSQAVTQVARRWDRAAESLILKWREGSALYALRNEEEWQHCLRMHQRGPVELVLQSAEPKSRPAKRTLAGLAASSRPGPPAKAKSAQASRPSISSGVTSIKVGG